MNIEACETCMTSLVPIFPNPANFFEALLT